MTIPDLAYWALLHVKEIAMRLHLDWKGSRVHSFSAFVIYNVIDISSVILMFKLIIVLRK